MNGDSATEPFLRLNDDYMAGEGTHRSLTRQLDNANRTKWLIRRTSFGQICTGYTQRKATARLDLAEARLSFGRRKIELSANQEDTWQAKPFSICNFTLKLSQERLFKSHLVS